MVGTPFIDAWEEMEEASQVAYDKRFIGTLFLPSPFQCYSSKCRRAGYGQPLASGNIYVIVISNRIGSWSRLPFQYGVGAAEEGTN
jgi:hypothetical protein